MNVTNCPVCVVRQCIDSFDRHHWTFERRHTVEGQGNNEETQDRIRSQLAPAPDSVMMPLTIPPHDGANKIKENNIPKDCAQSGKAV